MSDLGDLMVPFEPCSRSAEEGVSHSIQYRECRNWRGFGYFLSVPTSLYEGAPVLVSVHGISRNAREHAETFARICSDLGWLLIVPVFSETGFPRYQKLGFHRSDPGPRADLALNAVLDEVRTDRGIQTEKIFIFGFSGGAQFAHRYALVHPERVLAAVLGASGWYTFPDWSAPFPRGLRVKPKQPNFGHKFEEALRIPMAVFVGSEDRCRDRSLNTRSKIDHQQGLTRRERGMRWVVAMQAAAASRGLDTPYLYHELPGCDHSFTKCVAKGQMGRQALQFLLHVALSSRPHSEHPATKESAIGPTLF